MSATSGFFVLIFVAILFLSPFWVIYDLSKIDLRKNSSPLLWFLFVLLVPVFGIIAYMLNRDAIKEKTIERPLKINPAPALISISGLDDIERLGILKEKGLITETEFETKKKQLLGL